MKSKLLVFRFTFIIISAVLIAVGCTKIDTTTIGGNVLPAVDNVNTFADTLDVSVKNYTDTQSDSTLVSPAIAHILGHIDDPLFGRTTANLYFQAGPQQFPFYYQKVKDSLLLDSAVLVVKFGAVYGDSLAKQKINVFRVTDDTFKVIHFRPTDTIAKFFRVNEDVLYDNSDLLGSAFVSPADLRPERKIDYKKDSLVSSQLRVRLRDDFGRSFLDQDSNTAFKNYDKFRAFFKGFALVPEVSAGGNALMYFLTNSDTKLMIYHRVLKPDGKTDTTVQAFSFGSGWSVANYVKRDRSSGEVAGHLDNNLADEVMYLQGTPGTFARVTIPGIENLSNRVVHRAELVFKQIWNGPQKIEDDLPPPAFVYTEIFNTDSNKVIRRPLFDTIIYNPALTGIYTGDYFFYTGGIYENSFDASGRVVGRYNINITRYVQSIITRRYKNYPLQLSIPYLPLRFIFYNNQQTPFVPLGSGRLKAGGGNHPQYKMYLRIIYSKIQ